MMQSRECRKCGGDKCGGMSSALCERVLSSGSCPREISECLSGWLTYMQTMNGLCNAGSRLSHALGLVVQDTSSPCYAIASQCYAMWEELLKATALATSAIKTQVLSSFQDMSSDLDSDRSHGHDINQQVVCGSLMTFINLQYQFSITCCEFLGSMANSNCCQTSEVAQGCHDPECCVGIVQQCFTRLYSPLTTSQSIGLHRVFKIPFNFPFSSLQGPQRRWSEAAADEVCGDISESTMRRWSMPWESSQLTEHHSSWHSRLNPSTKLAVPFLSSQDRSLSTTPDSVWHSGLASQEELQEVIHLLSCRPGLGQSTQLPYPSIHLPQQCCQRLRTATAYVCSTTCVAGVPLYTLNNPCFKDLWKTTQCRVYQTQH